MTIEHSQTKSQAGLFAAQTLPAFNSLPFFLTRNRIMLPFKVSNTSSLAWPASGIQPVRLGYFWLDEKGQLVEKGTHVCPLDADLRPGGSALLMLQIQAPSQAGRYILLVSPVQEGVAWFTEHGCQGLGLRAEVIERETYCAGEIRLNTALPSLFPAATQIKLPLRLYNQSDYIWPVNGEHPTRLSYEWLDATGQPLRQAHAKISSSLLPHSLSNHGHLDWFASLRTPEQPGNYYLKISLLQTNLALFESATSFKALLCKVRIESTLEQADYRIWHEENERAHYQLWRKQYAQLSETAQALLRQQVANWHNPPLLSVLIEGAGDWQRSLASVQRQLYPHWELFLTSDDPALPEQIATLPDATQAKIRCLDTAACSATAWNAGLQAAQGEYLLIMCAGDQLADYSLYFCAAEAEAAKRPTLIYFDRDDVDPATAQVQQPRFFPAPPQPDLFLLWPELSAQLVWHVESLRAAGGFRAEFPAALAYDASLRVQTTAGHIAHIPHVLYHRAQLPDVARQLRDAARALEDFCQRHGIHATTSIQAPHGLRLRYALPDEPPSVSIIIPTRNGLALLQRCLNSLRELTDYPHYEILIVDNQSDDPACLAYLRQLEETGQARLLAYPHPFNYAAMMNAAVAACDSELICLLNNDTEIVHADWLREMVSQAVRPDIGIVGACLWFPDDTLQHGGVVAFGPNKLEHRAYRFSKTQLQRQGAYLNLAYNPIAVTGACQVMRRRLYQQLGGMQANCLPIQFNDIDLCFKASQQGFRSLWLADVQLYHHESATRRSKLSLEKQARSDKEINYLYSHWRQLLRTDLAYNPNLSLDEEDALSFPPRALLEQSIRAYDKSAPKLMLLNFAANTPSSFVDWLEHQYPGRVGLRVDGHHLQRLLEGDTATHQELQAQSQRALYIQANMDSGLTTALGLNCRYLAVLRHPLLRIMAHYQALCSDMAFPKLAQFSVVECVQKGIIPANLITQIIAGTAREIISSSELERGPYAHLADWVGWLLPKALWRGDMNALRRRGKQAPVADEKLLKQALARINQGFVWLTTEEKLTAAAEELRKQQQWQESYFAERPGDFGLGRLSAAERAVLEQYNRLDLYLYQQIQQLPQACLN